MVCGYLGVRLGVVGVAGTRILGTLGMVGVSRCRAREFGTGSFLRGSHVEFVLGLARVGPVVIRTSPPTNGEVRGVRMCVVGSVNGDFVSLLEGLA